MISRILETSVDREDKIYRWGGRRVSALFTSFADSARPNTGGRDPPGGQRVSDAVGDGEHRRGRTP
nr:hypothetical protein KV8917_300001 [Klebsiella variicola]